MTPAQLDHLRRIDAHLANLLSTAEKRTPGEWEWTDANAVGEPQLTSEGGALVCTVHHECVKPVPELNACADFIAACAGNAEAGWRATRAAIAAFQQECPHGCLPHCPHQRANEKHIESILAAFPNV